MLFPTGGLADGGSLRGARLENASFVIIFKPQRAPGGKSIYHGFNVPVKFPCIQSLDSMSINTPDPISTAASSSTISLLTPSPALEATLKS